MVDDDTDTLALTKAILSARGFEVLLADCAEQAYAQIDKRPDVVLLDVMMPGTSGLDVLAKIRGVPTTAGLPVILLTARQQDRDLLEGYREGADYYITKPCTAQQILFGIRLVLGDGGAATPVRRERRRDRGRSVDTPTSPREIGR